MLGDKKRKFLFKCCECEMIVSVEFEKDDDIKDVANNKVLFECSCGGIQEVLLD